MEVDDSQLAAMGLHSKRVNLDEHLGFSKWDRKTELHTLVKAQTGTTDKPDAQNKVNGINISAVTHLILTKL